MTGSAQPLSSLEMERTATDAEQREEGGEGVGKQQTSTRMAGRVGCTRLGAINQGTRRSGATTAHAGEARPPIFAVCNLAHPR